MDFSKEVLERSQQIPVVVDFWAPWCGPCQVLGPILEGLAATAADKWQLVKVNTDENQEISAQYGIRGIPAVKMFSQGEVIAEFTGALPQFEVEKWLDRYLPDERLEKVDQFRALLQESNDKDKVIEELSAFVAQEPDLAEAKLLLAAQIVFDLPEEAVALVSPQSLNNKHLVEAQDIRDLAHLMTCELDGNESINKLISNARETALIGDYDGLLDLLIEAVSIDKSYCKELPRKSTIALFRLLGNEHPLTKKYRKRFDMALY